MIDRTTKERIEVRTDSSGGPYIRLRVDQLDAVCEVLDEHGVKYWVDEYSISIGGRPAMIVITIYRSENRDRIQKLLDDAS